MTKCRNFAKIIIGDSMNIKRIAYGLLCVGLVLLISGCFSSFLISLQNDKSEVLRRMDDVGSEFEAFSTNTSIFEDVRDELYNEVLGNVYYDTMFDTDDSVKNKLSNYENLVDELTKSVKALDKLCDDMYYPNSEVNNMCNNYKSIYEQVVNYFVTDIKVYNDNVKKYNNYQKSISSVYSVKNYTTDKKYIDYNGDKVFDGKEE